MWDGGRSSGLGPHLRALSGSQYIYRGHRIRGWFVNKVRGSPTLVALTADGDEHSKMERNTGKERIADLGAMCMI